MPGPKIVMVGGGSYTWCPQLLSDLMQTEPLEGSELVLLDPNLRAAGEIAAAGEAIAAALGRHFTITVTDRAPAAFEGADFVIITISTGGLKAMAHDLAVPEKYGIFHTVGDTVGPGGWSRALRNVPVFVRLARQIEQHSPRAVVLNYTNPLSVLTGVFAEVGNLRAVGLCHGVFGTYEALEKLFGVQEKDLAVQFGGVNHFFWVTDFTINGRPGYPLLRQRLSGQTLAEALGDGSKDAIGWHSRHAVASELFQRHGYLTYIADRHICEFLPGYITPTADRLKRYNLVRTSIAHRQGSLKSSRQAALDLAAGRRPPFARSRETAVDIMLAIWQGKPFVDVVNLPNVGQISNLMPGAVVETLGLIDGLGFRPIAVGPLPPEIRALVKPHCLCQGMTLRAALDGNRELALQALLADPICQHLPASGIRRMGLELMSATKPWLPKWAH